MELLQTLWDKHNALIIDGAIGVVIITFFTFVLLNMIQNARNKKLPRWFKVLTPLPIGSLFFVLADRTMSIELVIKGFILGCVTTTFYDSIAKRIIVFIQSKFGINTENKKG